MENAVGRPRSSFTVFLAPALALRVIGQIINHAVDAPKWGISWDTILIGGPGYCNITAYSAMAYHWVKANIEAEQPVKKEKRSEKRKSREPAPPAPPREASVAVFYATVGANVVMYILTAALCVSMLLDELLDGTKVNQWHTVEAFWAVFLSSAASVGFFLFWRSVTRTLGAFSFARLEPVVRVKRGALMLVVVFALKAMAIMLFIVMFQGDYYVVIISGLTPSEQWRPEWYEPLQSSLFMLFLEAVPAAVTMHMLSNVCDASASAVADDEFDRTPLFSIPGGGPSLSTR